MKEVEPQVGVRVVRQWVIPHDTRWPDKGYCRITLLACGERLLPLMTETGVDESGQGNNREAFSFPAYVSVYFAEGGEIPCFAALKLAQIETEKWYQRDGSVNKTRLFRVHAALTTLNKRFG